MKKFNLSLFTFSLGALCLLCGCSSNSAAKANVNAAGKNAINTSGIINYGKDQNWQKKLRRGNEKFRVIQIGDSHTAGDYFTGELRRVLQSQLGNGGIGWVYPTAVAGQRSATVQYSGSGWKTSTSRKDSGDFPLGGVMTGSGDMGTMTISPRDYQSGEQKLTFMAKPIFAQRPLAIISRGTRKELENINVGKAKWQYGTATASLPFTYQAMAGDLWEVGAINIENAKGGGAVVSALGINGAKLTQWEKWRPALRDDLQATKADLVILAYGTNEAFNDTLNVAETEAYWTNTTRQIRKALPNAGILIVSAPESLRSKQGSCGVRPAMLDSVQAMQQRVAQKEKVMFWSWQQAMGGRCSMNKWIAQGLGRSDGVHFTDIGYQRAGGRLAQDLLKLAK